MRTYIYYIIIATLLCCSCIEEFDANLSSSDTKILCVEGTIQNNTDCTFYLSHSVPIKLEDEDYYEGFQVYDAKVAVRGSNGEQWQGHNVYGDYYNTYSSTIVPDDYYDDYGGWSGYGWYGGYGIYIVHVGQLDPSAQYWLEVTWNGNTYVSKPQLPLPTPEIEDLKWEMAVDSQYVNIMVTPAHTDAEKQFYRLNYEETWEVHTPLRANYEYDPEQDKIIPATVLLDVGWAHDYNHYDIYVSNENYQDGQIRNYVAYQVYKDDNRFNHRYYTRVYQTAISREEYEYQRLSAKLSDEMGGLFTPQPSALPTNIECQTADLQVIGYVGVSLNTSSAHVYINRKDVDHVDRRLVEIADEEFVAQHSPFDLWQQGWRVYEYFMGPIPTTWASRWCVDCTSPYWGASLVRPTFWED